MHLTRVYLIRIKRFSVRFSVQGDVMILIRVCVCEDLPHEHAESPERSDERRGGKRISCEICSFTSTHCTNQNTAHFTLVLLMINLTSVTRRSNTQHTNNTQLLPRLVQSSDSNYNVVPMSQEVQCLFFVARIRTASSCYDFILITLRLFPQNIATFIYCNIATFFS